MSKTVEWILSFFPCLVNQSDNCSFCPVWESLASKFVLVTLDVFLLPTFNFLIMVFCFTANSLYTMKQDITLMIVMWLAVKCGWVGWIELFKWMNEWIWVEHVSGKSRIWRILKVQQIPDNCVLHVDQPWYI